jgi:CubicO group peptidase (beta-lactamase class C family)
MRPLVKLGLALACGAALASSASGGGAQTGASGGPPAASAAAQAQVQSPAAPPAVPPHAAPQSRTQIAAAAAAAAALPPPLPGARLSSGAPIPAVELEAFVDGVVRQAMDRDHIAGVEVSVVQNGQVVLKKGYGFAGQGRAVDPDATLFRIGSISKTFTWIALMKDSEAGRIRLDTPINLYLPESLQVKDQGFKQPILVRDLMNHDAGFADRTLGQLIEQDPRRVRPLAVYLRQERPRRVREPGVLPTYSNYGAALAGEAVAWVDGRPYQDIVEAEITRPLQMAHTSFREPYPPRADLPAPMAADLAARLSTGYRWAGGDFVPERFEFASQAAPAGAASSTAGDMARYMLMILNGGQLDGASLYGAETAHGFRTTGKAAAPGVNGLDDGFLEFSLPGGFRGQGHLGDTLWFHSAMVTVPDLNLGVFVTTNTDQGGDLAENLPGKIVGRFYAPPSEAPRPGAPALAAQARVYDGTYLTTRRPYNGLEAFVSYLTGQAKVRVTPDGRLLIATGAGVHAWVPRGAAGQFIRADGPQTSAFRIENGRAVRWYHPLGAVAYDRIGPLRQTPTLALAAALAGLASIATLVGLFTRDRREFRQTPMQARAGQVQTAIAVLWLLAMGLFGVFLARSGDVGYVMYAWPTPYLLIGSACALVAALLTGLTVLMAPAVWRGGRRVDSWTAWRKLRFSLSTLIFAGFSVLLALWGALEPWSG